MIHGLGDALPPRRLVRLDQARRQPRPESGQRRNRVVELRPHADGWEVVTEHGTIIAEHVVNAAGLWARRVGRMVGIDLPLTPMQHHYLITEDLPELVARADEMPCCFSEFCGTENASDGGRIQASVAT